MPGPRVHLEIGPMHSSDISVVRNLHAILLPVPYALSFFLHLLIQPTRLCLLARDQGNPVAFISAVMHPEQRIEILTLGVVPAFRQRGLATHLLHAVIDTLAGTTAVPVFAQVSALDERAVNFYKHVGMHPTTDGVIRDMYRILPCGSRDGTRTLSLDGSPSRRLCKATRLY
ncbi:acyl-CoA N-acyltransferase [Mycena galericulata]|nr:acyl-CoA N-acyltransferase [Mycena galericulata]